MKKTMKKILALVLSMLMLLSVAAPVFANDVAATTGCPGEDKVHSIEILGEGNYKHISHHDREYCEDQEYDVYQCNTCGKYFADDIKAGVDCQWDVIKPATCTEKGMKKCTVCGYENEIDMIAHNLVPDVPCGYYEEEVTWSCTECDYSVVRTFGDKETATTVHNWTITVTKEPECNVPGEAHYVCTICNEEKFVSITAHADHAGHKWVKAEYQPGKCFEDNSPSEPTIMPGYYCEVCGVAAEIGQKIVVGEETITVTTKYEKIPVEHDINYDVPTSETAPTCTTYGHQFFACKNCGYVDKEAIKVVPKLGHEWEREGFDITTLAPVVSVPCAPGVAGKDTYEVNCSCGASDLITIVHEVKIGELQKPTCEDSGYLYDYCSICGVHNQRNHADYPADPKYHDWFTSDEDAVKNGGTAEDYGIDVQPTCTDTGVGYTKCRYCFEAKYEIEVPKLGHNEIKTLDCLNGKWVITCSRCDYEVTEDIKDFDFNDPTFHQHWNKDTNKWDGDIDYLDDPTCTTEGLVLYICTNHIDKPVIVSLGYGHVYDEDPTSPTCKIDAKKPTCTEDGHGGYKKCTLCGEEWGKIDDVKPALGHDIDKETYIAPLDPTCAAEGHVGYEKCLRENCGYEKGIAGDEGIIEKAPHTITLITDMNMNAVNGWEIDEVQQNIFCDKYTYLHYGCTVCFDKETEYWVDYIAATGHKMDNVVIEPGCTTEGKQICSNDWCIENPDKFYEVIPMLKHIDENGNVIECVLPSVAKDFYCYRCCEPKLDEEGKFTGEYAKDALPWTESHYKSHVTVDKPGDCTAYYYVLHVCVECEAEWMETEAGFEKHLRPDDTDDNNWKVVKPEHLATFDAPGTESLVCGRLGCNYVFETREYTRKDIEFSFTVGNIYNDKYNKELSIVNSGYVAVKVNLAAYKQMLHSFKFTLNVNYANGQLLKYVGYDVPAEYSDVLHNKVYVGQNGNAITVYATIENDINNAVRDYEFTGSDNHVLTLYFKVADNANTENSTTKATFTMTGSNTEVLKVDETSIKSGFEAVAAEDIVVSVLGAVNDDAETTVGSVGNQIDVNAIYKLVAERGYVAEADIDKDGEITLTDFDLLAEYLVGNNTYGYICATDDCNIAGK